MSTRLHQLHDVHLPVLRSFPKQLKRKVLEIGRGLYFGPGRSGCRLAAIGSAIHALFQLDILLIAKTWGDRGCDTKSLGPGIGVLLN